MSNSILAWALKLTEFQDYLILDTFIESEVIEALLGLPTQRAAPVSSDGGTNAPGVLAIILSRVQYLLFALVDNSHGQ
jgi:hypothetical protein